MTPTGRRGRPEQGRPFENTTATKPQVHADGDTTSHPARAPQPAASRFRDLDERDRRTVLAARSHLRWGRTAIGSSTGVTFADSDRDFVVETLILIFAGTLEQAAG